MAENVFILNPEFLLFMLMSRPIPADAGFKQRLLLSTCDQEECWGVHVRVGAGGILEAGLGGADLGTLLRNAILLHACQVAKALWPDPYLQAVKRCMKHLCERPDV